MTGPARPSRRFRLAPAALLAAGAGLLALGGGLLYLQGQGVTPRALAPYIEKRSSGHNFLIEGVGRGVAGVLLGLDRGEGAAAVLPPDLAGAQPAAARRDDGARKLVGSAEEARRAIAAAVPGDVIVFLPGVYRIRGSVEATRPGNEDAPIAVRAGQPGSVTIEFDAVEGFRVSAPYWRFENLSIRGVCRQQESCEHAFHVVGGAHHFSALNNTILDFNAHFKINAENGRFPDAGLIESNTLAESAPRATAGPVTPVDLVAASDWVIRRNLITDFIKTGGDRVSYGAFAKGAGARNRFESNAIVCEQHLRGFPGQRVGLSFGGGGTGKPYCRDRKCVTEQDEGIMQNNLIASCSDVGIYLNAGARTRLLNNTLVDTAGVDVRFPESSAEADGNLVDGTIRSRNGGRLHPGDNLETPITLSYLGYHPLRDLCGGTRERERRYGAFQNAGICGGKAQ